MPDFKEFLLSCPKIDDQRIFERQEDDDYLEKKHS
ncbi:hypothetical protein U14_00719 [Candidatus Moduliflexus flocculans]|uniref:Uncharacterized protein n=1 Tax=Candidatus Moduliflexus flocculans TaxID=1499966 RepID=A0A0S6VV51_9BACT|nr:hypothetical protein U14_00719 [Candidatus Moduliflexus flocculans]